MSGVTTRVVLVFLNRDKHAKRERKVKRTTLGLRTATVDQAGMKANCGVFKHKEMIYRDIH